MRIADLLLVFVILESAVYGQTGVEVSVRDTSGAAGQTVSIPIDITDTTGKNIIAATIVLQYDSGLLSFVDTDLSGTIASGWQVVTNSQTPGKVSINMIFNATQQKPLSGSGVLLNIKFLVQPNARTGATSQLKLAEVRLNDAIPITLNGIFTVGSGQPGTGLEGDIDGDNRVDRSDLLKLVLAYGKNNGDTGYNPAADLNSDGCINRNDVIILLRNFGARTKQES